MASLSPEILKQQYSELAQLEARFAGAAATEKPEIGIRFAQSLAEHGAYEWAIAILEQLQSLPLTEDQSLAVLQKLGQAHLRLSQYQQAYLYLGDALTQLSHRPGSLELFQVYYDLAWMFYRQGYLDNARSYIDGAALVLEESRLPPDNLRRAELLHISALVEAAQGNLETAAELLLQEAKYYKPDGEETRLAAIYNKLASIRYTQGRIAEALEYQGLTHSLAFKKGDHFRLAVSHKNYGDIHFILGDFSQALRHYQESEDICRFLDNGLGQAFAWQAMGRIKTLWSDYGPGKNFLDRALELARSLRNRDREVSILLDLAEWNCLQGKTEAALGCLKMAAGIDYDRGQLPSPKHLILKAWALNCNHELASSMEAQRILEGLLSSSLKIDDEEMATIPELEAEARHQLSLSLRLMKKDGPSLQARDAARQILKRMAAAIPGEFQQTFWQKPNVKRIMEAD